MKVLMNTSRSFNKLCDLAPRKIICAVVLKGRISLCEMTEFEFGHLMKLLEKWF